MRFQDVPQMTKYANYRINLSWRYLEEWLEGIRVDYGLELDPEYQRDHVWTEIQEIRFIEWILRGGYTGKEIHFNSKGWQLIAKPQLVELVDGKQRLKAVLRFLKSEIPAFGILFKDYTDKLPRDAEFIIHINDLDSRKDVMQWYVDMNAGGTVHTEQEIEKVLNLIEQES